MSSRRHATILLCFGTYLLAGCNGKPSDPKSEAPPAAVVQTDTDVNLVHVDHPDQFTLVAATNYATTSTIQVTGTVTWNREKPQIKVEDPDQIKIVTKK